MLEEEIIGLLVESGKTLTVAESCTGGLIGHRLTQVSGSSAAFLGGVVAYHNSVKEKTLGVPADILEREGAVSEATALAMAEGVRCLLEADIAVAVTGIAGPTGGTKDKPVGLVYIALSGPAGTTVKECLFSERLGREAVRDRTAKTALNLLRLTLVKGPT